MKTKCQDPRPLGWTLKCSQAWDVCRGQGWKPDAGAQAWGLSRWEAPLGIVLEVCPGRGESTGLRGAGEREPGLALRERGAGDWVTKVASGTQNPPPG